MTKQNTVHKIPVGFLASGINAGIKKTNKDLDLALICSEVPASVGAVFTTNAFAAAPVIVGKEILRRGKAQAIIINSGNANSCTGAQGLKDARQVAKQAAKQLGMDEKLLVPSSTGVIGVLLPVNRIVKALPALKDALKADGFTNAAKAIMTTDSFPKMASGKVALSRGKKAAIFGMAKGAGMIEPNMATMLAFICTDAAVEPKLLKKMTRAVVNETFNRISVDGDRSTNDSVFVLANGMSGAEVKTSTQISDFMWQLREVMATLARMIVEDGEGATKIIVIKVRGARTKKDADRAARAVGNSLLFKTAMHGEDPNWGRIAMAVGTCGAKINQNRFSIKLGNIQAVSKGVQVEGFSEAKARKAISGKEVIIEVNLGVGKQSADFLTCDLSKKYVDINAHYRT